MKKIFKVMFCAILICTSLAVLSSCSKDSSAEDIVINPRH